MWLLLIIIGIVLMVVGPMGYKKRWFRGMNPPLMKNSFLSIGIILLIIGVSLTSVVFTPTKNTAHLTKKFGSELIDGRVIAINGERGRQSILLQEGWSFNLGIRVLNDIEFVPYEVIPEGMVGLLTAVDGAPLGKDLFIAPDWVDMFPDSIQRNDIERNMLDPKYFIENGGRKGPQLNVLTPAEYKINKFMWNVDIVPATKIPDGHVGVIISRVGLVPSNIQIENSGSRLATPVVNKGYMGIWRDVLKPGMYYLNRHPESNKGAYEVKLIDTRVQTWTYKGGYDYYTIDLTIDKNGKITQTKSKINTANTPKGAADKAIMSRSVDGWDVFVDGRVLVQVQPKDAPYIIASVGGLTELENKIITPLIRSVIRNNSENREAPSFVFERSIIESEIDSTLKLKNTGSWLTIKDFIMNNVYIKPELLVPDKRKQLASKLKDTYKQETLAYREKIKTEKAREEAAQQGKLVEAKIADDAAALYASAEHKKGIGTRDRMMEEAKGQAALRDVLGIENTFKIEMANVVKTFPDASWQVPIFHSGGGNGTAGDAYTAITINKMLETMETIGVDPVVLETQVDKYNKSKKKVKTTPVKPTELTPVD